MAFWKMIKEGNDHFEVTLQEPKVDFCEKKYVFNGVKAPDARREPVFEASAKCPVYVVPEEVAQAVQEKEEADQAEFAKLVARGTPVAQINTGIDGGMHRVFAAKLPGGSTGLSEGGSGLALLTLDKPPGTIPAGVNPPRGPVTAPDQPLAASLAPASSPATTASSTRVAAVAPAAQNTESEGFFSSLARKVGLSSASADATAAPTQQTAPARPKTADAKPPRPEASIPKPSKSDTKQAAAKPPLKPAVADTSAADAPAATPAAPNLVAGAQPIVSANSFESRFSAAK
jgi:hypothetical protein